jgi:predicted nicotinamide N-methyase
LNPQLALVLAFLCCIHRVLNERKAAVASKPGLPSITVGSRRTDGSKGYCVPDLPEILLFEAESRSDGGTGGSPWVSSLVVQGLAAVHGEHLFAGKRVLEFGAGAGLGGLAVASMPAAAAACVHMSNAADGVAGCQASIELNRGALTCADTLSLRLAWQDAAEARPLAGDELYDVAILADCLFKNTWELLLAHTLARLKPKATVVVVSPHARFQNFIDSFVYALAEHATVFRRKVWAHLHTTVRDSEDATSVYRAPFAVFVLELDRREQG